MKFNPKEQMTKARSKVNLDKAEIETQAELLEAVRLVSQWMLEERELKNAMDTQLQLVRDRFTTDLKDLADSIEAKTELCAEYCTQHPDLLPKDRKSLDLTHALIGFRTGTPKVKLLKRWTLDSALIAIKVRKWFRFVRTTEEIDKEAVIAARAEIPNEVLASVGLQIAQAETFFIEPKLEQQPTGVKVEA